MLGRVGLPEPVIELAARRWDVVVVGGGHNGLTAAAYLARAGPFRARAGGAASSSAARATLDRPFADERLPRQPVRVRRRAAAPAGRRGAGPAPPRVRPRPARPQPLVPVRGRHVDRRVRRRRAHARAGRRARARPTSTASAPTRRCSSASAVALRTGPRDTWVGPSPDRAELAELLDRARPSTCSSTASIADVVEEHVRDERLRAVLHGQGVIGTWAGPRDPGTAAVHAMHAMGTLADGRWGYVRGGMGRVSFALADAAREHGAVLASGVPVAAIEPGDGVRLAGGELIRAAVVVSNADPKRTTELCAADVPTAWRARVADWRSDEPGAQDQLCAVAAAARSRRPPEPGAAAPRDGEHQPSGIDATQAAFEPGGRGPPGAVVGGGVLPRRPTTRRVAPPGGHVMSVFAQYVPYDLADGTWDARRDGDRRRRARRGRPLRAGRVRLRGRARGARAAGRRGPHRPHRRPHLPGRVPARPDVGPPLRAAHRRPRRLPLRRRDAPGRQRDRGQRPQRRDGRAGRRRPFDI